MRPPASESLRVADRWYAKALESATKVEEVKSYNGGAMVTYCWMLWPSRNTWPTKHLDRPAPTPGCGCADCHRIRCCNTWTEPVELALSGEVVAWICPTCLERADNPYDESWRP